MPHASAPRSVPADASAGPADLAAVARFLRGLAQRVEQDAAFGQQIAALLREAGVALERPAAAPARRAPRASGPGRQNSERAAAEPASLDPYGLLREVGEQALRTRLGALAAPDLHAVIRAHRLDPARISVRWTNQTRLIDLIVEQVRARADHGKAFSHV